MRLKYKILWFEDTDSWISGKLTHVKDIIEEHGFQWVEPTICNKDNFEGNYDEFDIILMDYSLVNGLHEGRTGADIIRKIRQNESYTTILFYSQNGESALRKEIAQKDLDGVFCADRDAFLPKFERVFETNIRKIEDVNNLRGLVMAETADIESLKEEIIELYDSIDCPKKENIVDKTLTELKDRSKKYTDLIESKTSLTPIKELIDIFDLYKKSLLLHRINHRNGTPHCKFKHENFNRDIIKKRNLLAHVQEQIINDGVTQKNILKSEKNGDTLEFSFEEARLIREDIKIYKTELEKLKIALSELQ